MAHCEHGPCVANSREQESGASPIDARHVDAVAALRARATHRAGHHQLLVERIARQIGRPRAIYVLLACIALWVGVNLAMREPFDKAPFFALQGILAVYASLVTTMVLTVQSRQQKEAEHQSSLELQVNLASEHKAAKIIELLEELRRDLPNVHDRRDTQAELLSRAVNTEAVSQALEERFEVPDATAPSRS